MSSRTSSPAPSDRVSDGSQSPIVSSAVERGQVEGIHGESTTRASYNGHMSSHFEGSVEQTSHSSSSHSSFYSEYKTVTLADTRCKLRLEKVGTHLWLHVEFPWWNCHLPKKDKIDLNQYISCVDGEIRWGGCGFFTDEHFEKVELSGTLLIVRLRHKWRVGSCDSRLDLLRFLHLHAGGIKVVAHVDFSDYMSRVSWMKFRVVAEPDMHALFSSSVFQGSVQGVADRAVLHVTKKVEAILTTVLKETMDVVLESSREFIQAELNAMVFSAYLQKTQTSSAALEFKERRHDEHVHRVYDHWGGQWNPHAEVLPPSVPCLPAPHSPHHSPRHLPGGDVHFPSGMPYGDDVIIPGGRSHGGDVHHPDGRPHTTGFLGGFSQGRNSPPFTPHFEQQAEAQLHRELQSVTEAHD